MNTPVQPPLWMRAAASVLRRVPPMRGRWRLERRLNQLVIGRHWHQRMSVNGCVMDLSLDDEIDRQIFLNGVYERAATAAIRQLPLHGTTIVDAGANMGYHTLLFAQCAGPQGHVHAIEPVSCNTGRLKHNLSLNPQLINRVTHWPVALSDSTGELEMIFAGPTHSGISHVAPVQTIHDSTREKAGEGTRLKVSTTTLDNLWEQLGRAKIDLLKLDLEGFEMRALQGAKRLFEASPPAFVLVEVIDAFLKSNGDSREALFAEMRRAGYRCYDFNEASRLFQANDIPHDTPLAIFSQRPL